MLQDDDSGAIKVRVVDGGPEGGTAQLELAKGPTKVMPAAAPINPQQNSSGATAKLLANRLYLTALAISLLWMSSLPVAQFVTSTILPATSEEEEDSVSTRISQALEFVQEETDTYAACMASRESHCTTALQRASGNEEGRVQSIQIENAAGLAEWRVDADTCESERQEAFLLLGDLQTTGQIVLEDLRTDSSDARCAGIDALITQESAKRASLELAASYESEAQALVDEMTDAMQARAAYDAQYLEQKQSVATASTAALKAQTAAQVQALEALRNESLHVSSCLRDDDDGATSGCAAVRSKLNQVPSLASEKYAQATQAYADLESRIEGLQATMQSFQDAYDAFVSGLALRVVSWVLDPPELDVQEMVYDALADKRAPALTAQGFQEKLAAAQDDLDTSLEELLAASDAATSQIVEAQMASASEESDERESVLSGLLGDYAPPETASVQRVQNAAESFAERTASFTESLEDTVDDLGIASSAALQTTAAASVDADAVDALLGTVTTNGVLSSYEAGSWDVFLYAGVRFQDFANGWDEVSRLALLFDIIFRCFTTLQIAHKYLRLSRVATPPVDLREHNRGKPLGRAPKETPLQRAASLVFHPLAGALVAACFTWAIGVAIASLYVPLFQRFVQGCVNADAPEPGTFLTQNAATLAAQYATREGSTVAAGAIDRLNNLASSTCAAQIVSSQNVLANQTQDFQELLAAATKAAEDLAILLECIDFDADALRASEVSSLVRLSPCKMDAGAAIADWDLRLDGVYNCTVLDPCDFDCSRPNDELLAYWTWQAGCSAERTLHHAVLQWFLAGAIYAALNVARILAVRGLRMILWASLSAGDHVSFVADVSPKAIDPAQVHCVLERNLAKFPRRGVALLGVAAVLVLGCVAMAAHLASLVS